MRNHGGEVNASCLSRFPVPPDACELVTHGVTLPRSRRRVDVAPFCFRLSSRDCSALKRSVTQTRFVLHVLMPTDKRKKTSKSDGATSTEKPAKKRATKTGRLSALPSLPLDVLFEVNRHPDTQFDEIPHRYLAICILAISYSLHAPAEALGTYCCRDSRPLFGGRSFSTPSKMDTRHVQWIFLSQLGLVSSGEDLGAAYVHLSSAKTAYANGCNQ